ELLLALDVHHDQGRAVVVGLEAALAHLPERHGEQSVGDVPGLRGTVLQRYVEQRLDHAPPAADQADGLPVAGPRRAPDDRPGLVRLEGGDRVPRGRLSGHAAILRRLSRSVSARLETTLSELP